MTVCRLVRGLAAAVIAASAAGAIFAAEAQTVVQAPSACDEACGKLAYEAEKQAAAFKLAHPLAYAKAALANGDAAAVLELARQLPLERDAPAGWKGDNNTDRLTINGVMQTNSLRIQLLYLMAKTAGADWVDWRAEIQELDLGEARSGFLLTSIAVKQAEGGHIESAVATARSHGRAEAEPEESVEAVDALCSIAAVLAERGAYGRALELVEEAWERCGGWCPRYSGGSGMDTAYRSDVEWAFMRIASAQARRGDAEGAEATVRLADKRVGGRNWLDKARRHIALAHARAGRPFEAVRATGTISRDEWRREVEREVERILNS